MEKKLYQFEGDVLSFEHVAIRKWKARTSAISESKARSNLIFQAKQKLGLAPYAKLSLAGKIQEL